MGSNWIHLSIELSQQGERSVVTRTLESDSRIQARADHNDSLVFDGPAERAETIERMKSVSPHIDRAVLVHSVDRIGDIFGYYYESGDHSLMKVEQIEAEREIHLASVFDHFARQYGIHGAI